MACSKFLNRNGADKAIRRRANKAAKALRRFEGFAPVKDPRQCAVLLGKKEAKKRR